MRMGSRQFVWLACFGMILVSIFSSSVVAWGPHIHISTPHISVPHVTIGPIAITPGGLVPNAAIKPAENAINGTLHAATTGVNGVATVATTALSLSPVQIVGVIAGKEKLSDAGKNLVKGPGVVIASVGEAVTETNAAVLNVPIVAAQDIAGNVGQTILTIGTGPERLQIDFAATAAIEAGGLMQGDSLKWSLAAPLAAAIRSAEKQFQSQSRPLPADVKVRLASAFSQDVLDNARYAIGSFSISVPDVINQVRKDFAGVDNAVTVGNITVFVRDPGNDYHWWAHELQHQVQYRQWNIDQFAYRYVTSCHEVETDAETKAQQVVPIPIPMNLAC
jgi:hypothetical protein